jgi:peptidoglycan/LPS O-acetylase OafA/YrhL
MNKALERVFGLDLLRAAAVCFVVYGHGYVYLPHVDEHTYRLPEIDGVTLFFVLSGFLIGRILLKTFAASGVSGRKLLQFWIRRWFRTLPNYFLVLGFLACFLWLRQGPTRENLLPYLVFSQNLAWPHPAFFPEAWSLSVEEWFYLCFPAMLFLGARFTSIDRRRLVLVLSVVVIGSIAAFRAYRAHRYGYASIGEWEPALRKQVVTRLDSIMFGVLGAYASLYRPRLWLKAPALCFIVGLVLILGEKLPGQNPFSSIFYWNYVALSADSFGVLLMLPLLSSWKRAPRALVTAVTFISVISYSMYLLNFTPMQEVVLPALWRACPSCGYTPGLRYLTYWIGTIALSYLLYRCFEQPTTALRDKIQADRQRAGTAVLPVRPYTS